MAARRQFRSSIHDNLILWIGSSVAGILLILFFLILAVEKEATVSKHRSIAMTMVQTAVIPLNDLLYQQSGDMQDDLQAFVKNFSQEYADQIKYAIVLDPDGVVKAHTDLIENGKTYTDQYSLAALESLNPEFHLFEHPEHGLVLDVSSPLGLVSLTHGALRIGLDSQPLVTDLRSALLMIIVLFSLALTVVIFIVYHVTRSLTRQLRRTVEAIDTFDFQTAEPLSLPEGDDEIGLLNDRFLKLQERLIRSRSMMEQTNQSLIRTEKLAALGRMAAGVAHEINNPLMGLKNCLHLLKIDPDQRDEHTRLLKEGLDRIESTVKSLLDGARRRSGTLRDFDVNTSVNDVLNLLSHRLSKEKVLTKLQLHEDLPTIHNNKSGFEEALLNICMNALDAIGGVGSIGITTMQVDDKVLVQVCDSGPGISETVREHLFEPFVTTKEVGKGTGLGLYVTREIIETMGGSITCGSCELGGAQFNIHIPIKFSQEGEG